MWETCWCVVTISHGLSVLRCACMVRREQFSIPQATPAYEEMVQQLPSEFVGPASSKLTALPTPLSAASCLGSPAQNVSQAPQAPSRYSTSSVAECVCYVPEPERHWVCSAGLVPLVQLLCAEMGHAFEVRSMTCPPWRQAKAMLSKWLPAKVGCCSGMPGPWGLPLLALTQLIASSSTGA